MCGIVFNIRGSPEPIDEDEWDQLVLINAQRGERFDWYRDDRKKKINKRGAGPHAQKTVTVDHGLNRMRFFSSVLHLRGDHVAVQPHQREEDILCWNGEVFRTL
jgi:hypothetical protein